MELYYSLMMKCNSDLCLQYSHSDAYAPLVYSLRELIFRLHCRSGIYQDSFLASVLTIAWKAPAYSECLLSGLLQRQNSECSYLHTRYQARTSQTVTDIDLAPYSGLKYYLTGHLIQCNSVCATKPIKVSKVHRSAKSISNSFSPVWGLLLCVKVVVEQLLPSLDIL